MSLLDRFAPHVVYVQKRDVVMSARGKPELVPVGEPIRVRCSVQGAREWATEEEVTDMGLQVLSIRRIFTRDWPGDVNALVYYEGEVFEHIGDPVRNTMSRATRHYSVTVRWIGKDKR